MVIPQGVRDPKYALDITFDGLHPNAEATFDGYVRDDNAAHWQGIPENPGLACQTRSPKIYRQYVLC